MTSFSIYRQYMLQALLYSLNMNGFIARGGLIAAALLSSGCSTIVATPALLEPSFVAGIVTSSLHVPERNQNASEVLVLQIVQSQDLRIHLQTNFYTRNPECARSTWPTAPKTSLSYEEVIEIPTSSESAEVVVLLDKFKLGTCQWTFGSISASIEQRSIAPRPEKRWQGILLVASGAAKTTALDKITFSCKPTNSNSPDLFCWERNLQTGIVRLPDTLRKLQINFSTDAILNTVHGLAK